MALDKDILGQALYTFREGFNDKNIDELIMLYSTMEGVRLAYAKGEANVIINHFETAGIIPGTGLFAGSTPVTGTTKIT